MRRAGLILLALRLSWGELASAQDLNLTVVVGLVQAPNAQANTGLQEWSQAFERHVGVVGFDVMTRHYPGRAIRIQSRKLARAPDPAELQSWWFQQEAIYVMGALAVSPSPSVTVIEATVYMGEFRGHLASPVLSVRQAVRSSDYAASQKALEAITLYGLGNQALATGRSRIACAIYGRATAALVGVEVSPMRLQALPTALAASKGDAQC